EVGSYVEFTVTVPAAATVALTFRYANGTTTNRPVDVAVNGAALTSLAFPGTGSWDTWQTATATATLAAGTNTVRATSTTVNGGPNLDSMTVASGGGGGTDWSTAVVDSTMTRFTPGTLGGWSYTRGLYLYGQYLVYKRTHNAKYLAYVKSWADRFVDGSGHISNSFNSLDSMESANVLLALVTEAQDPRYQQAATQVRRRQLGPAGQPSLGAALVPGDRLVRHGEHRDPRAAAGHPPQPDPAGRRRPEAGRRDGPLPGLQRPVVPGRRPGRPGPEELHRDVLLGDVHLRHLAGGRARVRGQQLQDGGQQGLPGR